MDVCIIVIISGYIYNMLYVIYRNMMQITRKSNYIKQNAI